MPDRIIFILMVFLAALYLYATEQFPPLEIGDPLGPKAFPRLLGAGLLIAAACLLASVLQSRKTGEAKGEEPGPRDSRPALVVAAAVVWTGLYFAVFTPLGYAIATTIYLLALTAYFHRGKWKTNLLTSLLYGFVSYLMFTRLLDVSLPRGILPF